MGYDLIWCSTPSRGQLWASWRNCAPGMLKQHSLLDNPGHRRLCHRCPNPPTIFTAWGWRRTWTQRRLSQEGSLALTVITTCYTCASPVLWAVLLSSHSDLLVTQVTWGQGSRTIGSGRAHCGSQSSMLEQSTWYPQSIFPLRATIPPTSSPEKLAGEDQPRFWWHSRGPEVMSPI